MARLYNQMKLSKTEQFGGTMKIRAILIAGAAVVTLSGCSNAKEDEAERLGFSSAEEMTEVHSKGWHTKAQYMADEGARAKRFGFVDVDELHRADEAGVKTKAEYDKYVADLDAKNEAFSKEEAAREAAKAANDGDDSSSGTSSKSVAINFNDAKSIDTALGTEAASACGYDADDYLRKVAKHDFKWDDDATGMFGVKFGSFLQKVSKPGVIVYVSDRAKLQNGFGAFTRIKLYCEYDAKSKKVLNFYTDAN